MPGTEFPSAKIGSYLSSQVIALAVAVRLAFSLAGHPIFGKPALGTSNHNHPDNLIGINPAFANSRPRHTTNIFAIDTGVGKAKNRFMQTAIIKHGLGSRRPASSVHRTTSPILGNPLLLPRHGEIPALTKSQVYESLSIV